MSTPTRTPPIHPRKRPPSDTPPPHVEEMLVLAQPAERYKLTVDFGEAYAALHGQRVRGRAPPMHVDLMIRIERVERHGSTEAAGDSILRGFVTWRAAGTASKGFRCPVELRCPMTPTPKFPVQLLVGNEGEHGGMMDGSWIVGQFGTVVSAERIDESLDKK
jgi:hypothetical protein